MRPTVPANTPKPPPRELQRARRLVERGLQAYGRGEYTLAEKWLKEAIVLYPFLPAANLALGKVFLIRGSAERDLALINSARLMFEMARAVDPNQTEPEILLQLFQPPPE